MTARKITKTVALMDEELHQKLKLLSVTEKKSIVALTIEAFEDLIKKYK